MKSNTKFLYGIIAVAFVLSVVGISVGFAAMSSNLTVKGQAEVVPASWKIKFKDLSNPTINGGAEVVTAPQIESDTHIGNYDVKLFVPGDSVTYTFKIANDGTIDAELSSYTIATPTITGTGDSAVSDASIVASNLVYTLTYADGSAIQKNDELLKKTDKTLKLTVAYDANATELPVNQVDISGMDITFTYAQK